MHSNRYDNVTFEIKSVEIRKERGRIRLRFGEDLSVFSKDKSFKAESSSCDDLSGAGVCNYISWDTAVCHYPHLVCDGFEETPLVEKGEGVCFELSREKLGSEWIVQLPLFESDGYSNGDDEESAEWDELVEDEFDFHFNSFLGTGRYHEEFGDGIGADHLWWTS